MEKEEAIEVLQQMIDAECLVLDGMETAGEMDMDIDRRPLEALVAGQSALRESLASSEVR